MNAAVRRGIGTAIGQATGEAFDDFTSTPAGGGCINETFHLHLGPRSYFLKLNSSAPLSMFEAERDALQAIADSKTILVPRPVTCGESSGASFLVLEFLNLRRGTDSAYRKLGEQLAAMHRQSSPTGQHGWTRSNFIGSTPQPNTWHQEWVTFWREERLGHQFRLAASDGHHFKNADRLLDGLDALLAGHQPVPSLLHGDLWGGNIAFTDDDTPVIYDPASYYGDRETDLAMTRLFGSLPPVFYEAYHAAYPLPDGYQVRREFYNLYHVLNHAHLFGGHYHGQAQAMINDLLRHL